MRSNVRSFSCCAVSAALFASSFSFSNSFFVASSFLGRPGFLFSFIGSILQADRDTVNSSTKWFSLTNCDTEWKCKVLSLAVKQANHAATMQTLFRPGYYPTTAGGPHIRTVMLKSQVPYFWGHIIQGAFIIIIRFERNDLNWSLFRKYEGELIFEPVQKLNEFVYSLFTLKFGTCKTSPLNIFRCYRASMISEWDIPLWWYWTSTFSLFEISIRRHSVSRFSTFEIMVRFGTPPSGITDIIM